MIGGSLSRRYAKALFELALGERREEEVGEEIVLEDREDGPDALRVFLSLGEARDFAKQAELIVAAGRPPCPLCGNPLDAEGHICPRQNGHRR